MDSRGGGDIEAALRGPSKGTPEYPPDHQPGMRVPTGGSMCKNCEYVNAADNTCTNDYFVKWNGSNVIPAPIDSYCSDYYAPAAGMLGETVPEGNA